MPSAATTVLLRALPLALVLWALPAPALAGPWTLPTGALVLDVRTSLQQAQNEWLVTGRFTPFSLRGEYLGTVVAVGARYGITDRLELALSIEAKALSYRADPVVLMPPPDGSPASAYQQAVQEISTASAGLGDAYIASSYNFVRRAVLLAGELRAKLPLFYRAPQGNFSYPKDQIPPEVLAHFAGPVKSDLSLGSGSIDLAALLELGAAIPALRAFVRADAGVNFRFGGPGQQFLAGLRLGESAGSVVTLVVGSQLAYTLNRGSLIGTTVNPIDAGVPASEYSGLKNLELNNLSRDTDYVIVDGGVVFNLGRGFELLLDYSHVVWGRNIAEVRNLTLGISGRVL